jgi:hypothetical protein
MDRDSMPKLAPPCPTVLLLHEVPDGTAHVDWMIAPEERGESRLITFRLERSLDALSPGESLPAVRLADHRRRYLDYEGPISGSRGSVRRLAQGRVTACRSAAHALEMDVEWARGAEQRLRLVRHESAGAATSAESERWSVILLASGRPSGYIGSGQLA